MQERNLEIELLLLSNEQACIEADYKAMDILIENLMHNAYHYTLPHGQVQVRMERTTEVMTVKIIDSGVGIDEDEIDQVFEQLYRGRSADAGPTDARGMGLGLYFAKYIVEAHGGVINLYSERNVGTEVSFTLPVRQQDPDRSVSS
jgi:signal transduction histidine kinase